LPKEEEEDVIYIPLSLLQFSSRPYQLSSTETFECRDQVCYELNCWQKSCSNLHKIKTNGQTSEYHRKLWATVFWYL